MYGWMAGLFFFLGCDEDVASRISLDLADDVPSWRMDLNPLSVAEGVDNNITLDIEFEAVNVDLEREMEWQAFRVQYGLGDDFSPLLTGTLSLTQFEGSPATITIRGAEQAQLDWVFDRYSEGELLV
ncbi:MAG: hypothetical protein AAF602_32375, partial [Myxococcota bacterium]